MFHQIEVKLKSISPDNLRWSTYLSYQPTNKLFIAAQILTKNKTMSPTEIREASHLAYNLDFSNITDTKWESNLQ